MSKDKVILQFICDTAWYGMETHRLERLRCGHHDITGKRRDGTVIVGLYQDEIDKYESGCDLIRKAAGQETTSE